MISKMKKMIPMIAIAGLLVAALSACETSDDNKIEQARACLDKNSGSAAQQCMAILNGINGPEADKLRAKIQFESNNIVLKIINNIKTGFNAVLGALLSTVGGGQASMDSAALTLSYAQASGDTNMIAIATFNYVANLCGNSGVGADAVAQVKDGCTKVANGTAPAIGTYAGGASAQTDLNNKVTILQQDLCASPSAQASTDPNNPCKKMNDAIAANPSNPAAALATYINNGS